MFLPSTETSRSAHERNEILRPPILNLRQSGVGIWTFLRFNDIKSDGTIEAADHLMYKAKNTGENLFRSSSCFWLEAT